MEEEVTAIVGPGGKHNRAQRAVRHGQEDGRVVLGGRRVPIKRPCVRRHRWPGGATAELCRLSGRTPADHSGTGAHVARPL